MEIDLDLFMTVLGLIATIFVGYVGVRYTLKYRKHTDIIFLKNACLSLFKTIVRNLDDIEIRYRSKKIDENLILLKGTFFNNGNVDIDKSIVHKPLEIELPENFSWVTYKITDTSNDLNVDLAADDKILAFEWDLFKEGEYFTFDCLIEYKQSSENIGEGREDVSRVLLNQIRFNHRITNLKAVNKGGSIPQPQSVGFLLTFSIFALSLIAGGYYLAVGQYFFPSYKVLYEASIDSDEQYVQLQATSSTTITLLDRDQKELITIPKEKVNDVVSNGFVLVREDISYGKLIGFGAFSTLYLFAIIGMLISEAQERKLYKKLKSVADKQDHIVRDTTGERGGYE